MHDHIPVYTETFAPNQEIVFHAKLREWLGQYWNLKDTETLHIQEIGCDDNSCPVFETLVIATEDPNLDLEAAVSASHTHTNAQLNTETQEKILNKHNSANTRVLKLGKAKHLLTKQDIYFSVEKQKINII